MSTVVKSLRDLFSFFILLTEPPPSVATKYGGSVAIKSMLLSGIFFITSKQLPCMSRHTLSLSLSLSLSQWRYYIHWKHLSYLHLK